MGQPRLAVRVDNAQPDGSSTRVGLSQSSSRCRARRCPATPSREALASAPADPSASRRRLASSFGPYPFLKRLLEYLQLWLNINQVRNHVCVSYTPFSLSLTQGARKGRESPP